MPTGLGASWTRHCRWQVRLLDADGEPRTTWRWADSLRDCRQELELADDPGAVSAQVKHDGDPYGVVGYAPRTGRGVVPVLRRVTTFDKEND